MQPEVVLDVLCGSKVPRFTEQAGERLNVIDNLERLKKVCDVDSERAPWILKELLSGQVNNVWNTLVRPIQDVVEDAQIIAPKVAYRPTGPKSCSALAVTLHDLSTIGTWRYNHADWQGRLELVFCGGGATLNY